MSILKRFGDIISANFNALLDKCEDPEKMIDKYMCDVKEDLAKVKSETANIMAEEKRAKRALDANDAEIAKYRSLAEAAVAKGNDGDASTFIAKKQALEVTGTSLQQTYDVAASNANKMRKLHDKLVNDITTLEQRRTAVKAKMAVAKTQQNINDITSSIGSANAAIGDFARMEAKADKMLDVANAEAELNEAPVDSAESLAEKYTTNTVSVADELARMKAEANK